MESEVCAIFCSQTDPMLALRTLPDRCDEVVELEEGWGRLEACRQGGSVKVSRGVPQPGNEVNRRRVSGFVARCEMLLGVVAPPGFSAERAPKACLFAVAGTLDGMVFDGRSMLGPAGRVVPASEDAPETPDGGDAA